MNDRHLVAVELNKDHVDILKRALGEGGSEDWWDDLENISQSIVELIERLGDLV